jgi:hypothetical protein
MLLSIAALLIDFWGGQLNFLGRLSEPLKEGQSYRSDINTWHTVIQMRHLKSEDVQVVLEMVVEKGIEPVKTIELKYIRSMGQFVKQSKLVCSGLSYSDARFEVDEQKGNVILIATPKGQKDKIEKVLSTDFTRVKPCLLCP